MNSSTYQAGRHFLQIPGPTNVPDRILRAMDHPTIDHRGPAFAELGRKCLDGMKAVFKTDTAVIIYPASGTGAWEAALANLVNEGERVLMVETGHFATLWKKMADKLGIETEFLETDWRRGVDPQAIEDRLRADSALGGSGLGLSETIFQQMSILQEADTSGKEALKKHQQQQGYLNDIKH